MKKNILVTGSNGQLGNEIRVLDEADKDNFIFTDVEELDITDSKAVSDFFQNNKIDLIINVAAYTNVDKAETDQDIAKKINVDGIANLTLQAQKSDIPLIHISTDYVFDGTSNVPYTENDTPKPVGIYGKTKYEGEIEALKHSKTIVIRTSWLYSSFGNNFVKTILRIAENPEIRVVFDQIGTPTYAANLAQAIISIKQKIFENKENDYAGIYHFSNEGVCSWYDFAVMILKFTGKNTKIIPVRSKEFQRPAPRPAYSVLDKTKIKKKFDIVIPYWTDSLKKCLKIIEKN